MRRISADRPSRQVYLNRIFSLNLVTWAVLGLTAGIQGDSLPIVRICIAAIHLVAGGLFWLRDDVREETTWRNLLLCVPGVVISGAMLSLSPELDVWPVHAIGLFLLGTSLTLLSFLSLGRSFSILPARREIQQTGAFAIVRHPIYASELLLLLACWSTHWNSPALLVCFAAGILLLVVRIRIEEELLSRDPNYQRYALRVRWRLIPAMW